MVKINGEYSECAGTVLSEYLAANNYSHDRIAVEINQQIIPKSEYAGTVINDGDEIEIVSFVGGG